MQRLAILFTLSAVLLGIGFFRTAAADEKGTTPAVIKCPVEGAPANLTVSAATDAGPVFFCCEGCRGKFEAAPDGFAAQVAEQRKVLATRDKIQVACPVTGEPVNPKVSESIDGQSVSFCCKGCIERYKAEPAKYARNLANAYTYQTMCPVMNKEVKGNVFTMMATGEKIYLCCKGCDKRLAKDPEKYAPVLEAQGVRLDLAKLKAAAGG